MIMLSKVNLWLLFGKPIDKVLNLTSPHRIVSKALHKLGRVKEQVAELPLPRFIHGKNMYT